MLYLKTKIMEIPKKINMLMMASVILLFTAPVIAQQIEVTPAKLNFTANPGTSQTKQVHVRNKGTTQQNFVFNLSDWLTDENGNVKYFEPGTVGRSCSKWLTVSPPLVTLQPNQTGTVNVTILVPENDNSTKWSVLFIQSAEEKTGPGAIDKNIQMGIHVAARIAVPIFQSPASNTLYKASIEGLTETVTDSTRTYNSKVINLGDKILNCKVFFTISNIATAEEFTSEPIEFSLLPESTKKITYTLDKALQPGRYSVAAVLDYGYNDQLEGVQLDIEVK
ncbi:MAG TPA: DUF916 domain-containing protein [Bacteroidetes bacterium]|nr:DUF916 domain-containing protein [Bacteroidota bacterium]